MIWSHYKWQLHQQIWATTVRIIMEEIDVILERPMQDPVIPFTLAKVSFLLLFPLAMRHMSRGRCIDTTVSFKGLVWPLRHISGWIHADQYTWI